MSLTTAAIWNSIFFATSTTQKLNVTPSKKLWVIALTLLFVSCANLKDEHRPGHTPAGETVLSNRFSIQTQFVDRACLSCHNSATVKNRMVDLRDISLLIEGNNHNHDHEGMRLNLIKPGCPKQSLFLSIVHEGKMPPAPNKPVDMKTLEAVENWIVSLNPTAESNCIGDEPPD